MKSTSSSSSSSSSSTSSSTSSSSSSSPLADTSRSAAGSARSGPRGAALPSGTSQPSPAGGPTSPVTSSMRAATSMTSPSTAPSSPATPQQQQNQQAGGSGTFFATAAATPGTPTTTATSTAIVSQGPNTTSPTPAPPPPPLATAAGGVLKRLRQLLWEGVSRLNEDQAAVSDATDVGVSPKSMKHSVPGSGMPAPTGSAAAGQQQAHRPEQQTALPHERLLQEALKRMSKANPLQTRLALIHELCEYARAYIISDIIRVWSTVKDLVGDDQPPYVRKLGYDIMLALIEGQYDNLGMLRLEFFSIIRKNTHNFIARLRNLTALTKNGQNIEPFEHDICQLLLSWLERGKDFLHEIISFASNVIKYNPYTIAEAPKTAFICCICDVCNNTSDAKLVLSCLNFLDILVRYSQVPERALIPFTNALCRTLNIEAYCQTSWSLMNNLLKSSCGHQGVVALCSILGDQQNYHAVNLLRGAVFYLSMASWGSYRIATLRVTHSAVLPYILKVLESKHYIVAYEVALSMNRLIKKYGGQMQIEWDCVLRIFHNLLPYLMGLEDDGHYSLLLAVQESLVLVHDLNKKSEFLGPVDSLLELLEDFSLFLPEDVAIDLITEKQLLINPAVDEWQHHLRRFLMSHFQQEPRLPVQVKALSILSIVFDDFYALYGDEILSAVLPVFDSTYSTGTFRLSTLVYKRGLSFLVHAASVTKTNKFFDLVDIMEKALRVPNDRQRYEAAMALIRLFIKKFRDKRHTHTLYILERLLKLAKDRQYLLRKVVISFLLSFRANSQYLMQLNISRQVKDKTNNVTVEEKQASFGESGADSSPTRNLPELDAESSKSRAKKPSSPPNSPINKTETTREELIPKSDQFINETLTSAFLVCWRSRQIPRPSSPPLVEKQTKKERVGLFPVPTLMDTLLATLQIETTFKIFKKVVHGMMEMLRNYYILRSADMSTIASTLCKLLRSGSFGMSLEPRKRLDKTSQGLLLQIGYELLVALIGYQSQLKPQHKEYMISCLCEGLTSNLLSIPPQYALAVQRTCINGLSISLSELAECMGQRISAIVGDLYKVCERNFETKAHMQVPQKSELARHMLEFFSFLFDAPTIMSFLKDSDRQRLFLTLMLLTNPNEFAPHVANQAYIVWADFFMESPVHLRLGYYRTAANYLLKRLLSEPRGISAAMDSNILLMATLDLFAQSVFGNCENTPLPPPNADFLFDNAQVRKWAQGNCIITMRIGKLGWVEVIVRRSAGSQRWIMQIQNMIYSVPAPSMTQKTGEYKTNSYLK